jgi:hypothetical protein
MRAMRPSRTVKRIASPTVRGSRPRRRRGSWKVGIGALAQRPVAIRGQLDVRETVTITFTGDPHEVSVADLLDLAGRVVDALEHG